MRSMVLPEAAPATPSPAASAPAPATPASAPAAPAGERTLAPSETVLAYADRVRSLAAAELTQEIQRLGNTTYTPVRAMQLALALAQSRTPPNATRAAALLQRVLAQGDGDAPALHPLARLLAAQLADQRRADEHAERQGQQLRDAQRRIEQLTERLEALRAIERSLPTRPGHEVQPRTTPQRSH